MLSAMQQRIYDYIAACIQTQGYPPSVREIGEAVGLRSPSTVHFHLKKLADAGVIEIGAGKGRAITLTHPAAPSVPEPEEPADRVPIVGNVAAGSPILAQECIEDYLTFHTGHPGCGSTELHPPGPVHSPRFGLDAVQLQKLFHRNKPIPLRLQRVHDLKRRLHGGGVDVMQQNDVAGLYVL